jgi:hypothetical protein
MSKARIMLGLIAAAALGRQVDRLLMVIGIEDGPEQALLARETAPAPEKLSEAPGLHVDLHCPSRIDEHFAVGSLDVWCRDGYVENFPLGRPPSNRSVPMCRAYGVDWVYADECHRCTWMSGDGDCRSWAHL